MQCDAVCCNGDDLYVWKQFVTHNYCSWLIWKRDIWFVIQMKVLSIFRDSYARLFGKSHMNGSWCPRKRCEWFVTHMKVINMQFVTPERLVCRSWLIWTSFRYFEKIRTVYMASWSHICSSWRGKRHDYGSWLTWTYVHQTYVQRIRLIKDGHLPKQRGKETWDFQRICTGIVAPRGKRLGERQRRTAWWARHSKDAANDESRNKYMKREAEARESCVYFVTHGVIYIVRDSYDKDWHWVTKKDTWNGKRRHRPRMEKSHSKRHELSFGGEVSIVMVLTAPQKSKYLNYW